MAENLDNPSIGNFGIEDTMEMGIGNRELIDTLFSPDSVTTSSDDIQDIPKEPKQKPKAPTTTAEKTTKAPAKKEGEDVVDDKPIKDLLFGEESEEEEEESTPAAKKETDDQDEDEPEKTNIFSTLTKELFKIGVFNKDEDEEEVDISTPEAFRDRFKQEAQKNAIGIVDKFIGQFGEEYQNAFESIFVKGVNPKEYFGAYNTIKDFASLDLTLESNQVAVIKQTLTNQGYEPDEITAEVERIKNYGDLESTAQRHHKVLVKNEAAKLAQLEQESEQRLQQQAAIKTQFVKNVQTVLQDRLTKKEFDGIPLNPKLVTEIQDFLLIDKYKTPSGETLTEFDRTILDLKRPENHEKKVKIALLLKILEKDPTLSTIQKTAVSKTSDALFGELARQKTPVKSEKTKSKPSSWFGNT